MFTTVTVTVPEALMVAASHTVVLLGKTDTFDAYTTSTWQDAAGSKYAVSSGPWSETQLAGVTQPEDFGQVVADYVANIPNLIWLLSHRLRPPSFCLIPRSLLVPTRSPRSGAWRDWRRWLPWA